MTKSLEIKSNITFLYYHNLEAAAHFYECVMGFGRTLDVGWAKLYAIHGGAFLGLVDGNKGIHQAKEDNAVLVTLVVENVYPWHDYLQEHQVSELSEVKDMESIQIRSFFFRDPGGYAIEIQQFLNPKVARDFHQID